MGIRGTHRRARQRRADAHHARVRPADGAERVRRGGARPREHPARQQEHQGTARVPGLRPRHARQRRRRRAVCLHGSAGERDARTRYCRRPLRADPPAPQGRRGTPHQHLAADAIEGLDYIDWLLLDDRNDILAALEHGTRALAHTSLVDIRIPFRDAYAGQSQFLQAIPWMQAHGLSFHGFANVGHKSLLPEGKFFAKNKATRWEWADAIFLPDAARLAGMDDVRTTKLACVADLAYGMHDLAAELLGRLDSDTASRYLDARGYVSPYFKEPDTFTLTVANAPIPWQDLKVDNPLPHAEGETA